MSRETIKRIITPNGDTMVDEVNDALRVNVVASVGGASGGGTEYAEGDDVTTPAPSGPLVMGRDLFGLAEPITLNVDGAVYVDSLTSLPVMISGSSGSVGVKSDDGFPFKAQLADGADYSLKASILDLTNTNPLTVAIVDGSGSQITSFGGGTQYTEGDTDASITGAAMLWEDGSDTLRAVSSAKPLPISVASLPLPATAATAALQTQPGVDIGDVTINNGAGAASVNIQDGGNTITVDGTVGITANSSVNVAQLAGTTTDTNSGNKSAGTLRVVLATDQPQLTNKLLVTPDANSAVNVAQMNGTAVTMNTGVVGTGVQRVVLATDVALPAGNNNIGDVDIASIAAGNNNIGDVDIASIAAGNNNIGDVDVASIAAGTNRIGSVRLVDSADADLTSVTSTQTSRFVGVQRSIDAGRTEVRFYAVAAAAGTTTTETAITLTRSSANSATSTGTSFVLTNGKRLRITHISVATRGNATATIQTTTFNFRINTAGAVGTTSTPVILSARSATAAVASDWDRYMIPLGEGMEILGNGTIQFGVTAAATYTTNAPTWDVTIIGYEY